VLKVCRTPGPIEKFHDWTWAAFNLQPSILVSFFLRFFYRDDSISYEAAFQLCPDYTQYTIFSRFNSWVTEAMGVNFLAQGNNSSRKPQLGIEPGTLRLPGRCLSSLPTFTPQIKEAAQATFCM